MGGFVGTGTGITGAAPAGHRAPSVRNLDHASVLVVEAGRLDH
jgi:hypothetical protein